MVTELAKIGPRRSLGVSRLSLSVAKRGEGMTVRVKHIPTRTCVACGRSAAKRDLVRVVRTPEGDVLVDTAGKLSGRGAYLCSDPACLRQGVEKGRLARALKATLSPSQREALLDALAVPEVLA